MGQSTDGILVFGVDLGEELPEFLQEAIDEYEGDFDTWLCIQAGIPQYGEKGYNSYRIQEYLERHPVTLVTHCSYDCPMYILGVRGSSKRASRGYPEEVSMGLDSGDIDALREFLAKYGIEEEPKWLLASMWS